MTIPEFEPSLRFVDESRIPCLKAVFRNSSIPRVAKRLADKNVADSEFTIYLRGKDRNNISAWQMVVLRELFEHEKMPLAIEQGLKALEAGMYGKYEGDDEIESHGFLPFVWITSVVVDDIREELIVSLDGHEKFKPHDSDMVIYRKGDGWEFDDRNYLSEYVSEVAIDEFVSQLGSDREADSPVVTDHEIVRGKWVFDPDATAQLQQLSGDSIGETRLFSHKGYTLEFASGRYRAFTNWRINPLGALRDNVVRALLRMTGKRLPVFCEYTGCELRGSFLTIQVREPGKEKSAPMTYRMGEDKLILSPELLVLSREK